MATTDTTLPVPPPVVPPVGRTSGIPDANMSAAPVPVPAPIIAPGPTPLNTPAPAPTKNSVVIGGPAVPAPVAPPKTGTLGSVANTPTEVKGQPTTQTKPAPPPKPVDIKVDTTDTKSVADAGLKIKQMEADAARTSALMQMESNRRGYAQKMAENKMTGGSLNALTALNERDLRGQFHDLNFKLASDIGNYLAQKMDVKEADAQAKLVSTFTNYVAEGQTEDAVNYATMMMEMFPDDPYWKTYANPEMIEALKRSMEPAEMERRGNALLSAWNSADQMGVDWLDDNSIRTSQALIINDLRKAYSKEDLSTGASNWSNLDSGKGAIDYMEEITGKDFNGNWTDIPQNIREDAWLKYQVDQHAAIQRQSQTEQEVSDGLLEIKDLTPAEKARLASKMGSLAAKDGSIAIEGINYPADMFSDMVNGAGSIFTTSWYGGEISDTLEPGLQAESDVLDNLWLSAVANAKGDLNMSRKEFMKAAEGYADSAGLDLTNPEAVQSNSKAMTKYMNTKAGPEDSGAWGSTSKWKTSVFGEGGEINDSAMTQQVNAIKGKGDEAVAEMGEYLSGLGLIPALTTGVPETMPESFKYVNGPDGVPMTYPAEGVARWMMSNEGGVLHPVKITWTPPAKGSTEATYSVFDPYSGITSGSTVKFKRQFVAPGGAPAPKQQSQTTAQPWDARFWGM